MKNLYETPEVGFVVFSANERIATNQQAPIPYNDEPVGPPAKPSEWVDEW